MVQHQMIQPWLTQDATWGAPAPPVPIDGEPASWVDQARARLMALLAEAEPAHFAQPRDQRTVFRGTYAVDSGWPESPLNEPWRSLYDALAAALHAENAPTFDALLTALRIEFARRGLVQEDPDA